MKDKLLFGTIGLLVGIIAMQWTMPNGQATVVTQPVGNVVAMHGAYSVLTTSGERWDKMPGQGWRKINDIPMPVAQVQFIIGDSLVDKTGDLWTFDATNGWVNQGQAPSSPVPTAQSTFGKVKAQYQSKGGKP